MSDLLDRLRALRGDAPDGERDGPGDVARDVAKDAVSDGWDEGSGPAPSAARFGGAAAQLGAVAVESPGGVHLLRRARLGRGARHGATPLGGGGLHPWLGRWAARGGAVWAPASAPAGGVDAPASGAGSVVYLDTETTGLAGGTGTYAFLVGLGRHDAGGFEVEQLFLPGPEHERAYLEALAQRLAGAAALVSYNGASFDLPLVRTRFALHGMPDPTEGVPHLDLLPLARRLWRARLSDCTLGTVERDVLGARRSGADVPGAEVPARYLAFLRSRDARPLRGVLEHNEVDIVALAAMRTRIEGMLDGPAEPEAARSDELHGLGRWLESLGETEAALTRFRAAEEDHPEARWDAARLLRRAGRHEAAASRWRVLAEAGDPRAWIELAKHLEHREGDLPAALEAVEAARRCGGRRLDDLDRRATRLRERLARRADADA